MLCGLSRTTCKNHYTQTLIEQEQQQLEQHIERVPTFLFLPGCIWAFPGLRFNHSSESNTIWLCAAEAAGPEQEITLSLSLFIMSSASEV